MPSKKTKYKCSKCDKGVYRKETVLCMSCNAKERTGKVRVDKELQRKRTKEYKQKYFQKNKKKIYQRRKSKPIDFERKQHYYIKSRYGISKVQYDKMLIDRNYTCDICGYVQPENATKIEKLYIDHCHVTNKIRGLICFSCNNAIGHFKDKIDVMKRAIKYLELWQGN